VFLVLEIPVHGVHEMDGRAANFLLEGRIDDLDPAVVFFGQFLGVFLGVGISTEIAPSAGGTGGVECEY